MSKPQTVTVTSSDGRSHRVSSADADLVDPAGAEDRAAARRAAQRARSGWTLDGSLGAAERFLRSTTGHVIDGAGDIEELARLAAMQETLAGAIDEAARRLLGWGASYREVGEALGISRQSVERRYPGASSRKPGAQPVGLR